MDEVSNSFIDDVKADDMLYKAKAAGRNRVMPQIKLINSPTEFRSQDE